MPSSLACVHGAHHDCSLKGCTCSCHLVTALKAVISRLRLLPKYERDRGYSDKDTRDIIREARAVLDANKDN